MESSTFPFCLVPATVDVSARCIPAIPVISGIDDPVELGPITRLPEGATLQFCGVGFNDLTVKIWWEGRYYFVFLEDLPDDRLRKRAGRNLCLGGMNLRSLERRDSMASVLSRIGTFWCKLMHRSAAWPIHGQYQCRRCFRYHKVRWE